MPDIPDPIARHITDGLLKLKVKNELQLQRVGRTTIWFFRPAPVTVGNTAAPAWLHLPPAPVKKSEPMLNDTESYF